MNKDFALLMETLTSNEEFKEIKLEGTKLTYKGKKIELKDFNFEYFLKQNPKFSQDLPNMTPEAVFSVIRLHAEYVNAEKEKQEEKAKQYIDTTPILKPFKVFKRKDSEKNEHSYIYYKDNKGINHVLADVDYKALFEAYKKVIQSDSLIKTDKEVFDILKSKAKEIPMEDLYTAEKRVGVKESHLNNLKKLMQDNNQALLGMNVEVIGNEAKSIYLNNGQLITIDPDKEGKVKVEKHDAETKENDAVDSVTIQDEIELISFNEYVKIIMNNETLNAEDKDKVKNYESFLFDIITYKEYLTPELYKIYQDWMDFYQKLYYVPVTTETIQETLKSYADMQERSKKVEITNSKAKEEVMKLTRKNPDQKSTGFVSAIVYIIFTIVMGILIASLMFIAS